MEMSSGNLKLAMKPALLDFICCPKCQGELRSTLLTSLVNGKLMCIHCNSAYDVINGVPVLLDNVSQAEQFTAKNFGEQWELFDKLGGMGEEFEERQFYEYLYPIEGSALKGKTILEAGCGYGRNLLQAIRCGATIAIGMDVGPAAFLAKCKGCDAVIGDILNPPFRRQFDVVFSFGVMHHVSDTELGLRNLYEQVANGGLFCHSVYSAENNWFLEHLFTPLRMRVFRHWSVKAKYGLAALLGVLTYSVFWLAYKPFSLVPKLHRWASQHLFYYDFMILIINKLGFKFWIAQLYDHLNAPIAIYISRPTIERWMGSLGLANTYFYFRNKNTWNFGGTKISRNRATI